MSRLLVLSPAPLTPHRAGPVIRAIEMARSLARAGHDVRLAAPGAATITVPEVTVERLADDTLAPLAAHSQAVIAPAFLLERFPALARVAAPLLVDLYDPLPFEALHVSPDRPLARRRYSHERTVALTLMAIHAADAILVANRRQGDWVLGLMTALGHVGPGEPDALARVIVAPYGIPGDRPTPVPGLEARAPFLSVSPDPPRAHASPVVVWPGGLWNWTDPVTAVEAIARLQDGTDRAPHLLLWGLAPPGEATGDRAPMDAADRARERARALDLLDQRVHFWNWVPYEERGHWLLAARAAISLHLPGLEARFAHRARVLDAIWASLPIVVTSGDPMASLVRRHRLGQVVPAQRPDLVARALARVFRSGAVMPARDAPRAKDGAPAGDDALSPTLRRRLGWDACCRMLARKLEHPEALRAPRRGCRSALSAWVRFLALRSPRLSIPLRLAARFLRRSPEGPDGPGSTMAARGAGRERQAHGRAAPGNGAGR